jgi:predicted ribosome quality control (RQC) complex YloA/Tae2 family protein
LHKRKITNEMIEARKPADFDFNQQEQEHDPVQELQATNLKLTNLIQDQAKEIEELKRLLNEKHSIKATLKKEEPVKKISKQLLKDFAKVKNMI